MRYIALLRGINVGGNTMIKMEELRNTFEALLFENVTSYINSGNLAFDSSKSSEEKLADMIEQAIETDFGRAVPVMLREQKDIKRILETNPFVGQFDSHKEMHVLFMKHEMPAEKRDQLLSQQSEHERFSISGREIYCHGRLGIAESLLGKGFIDKKLKVPATARNWRTVEKLASL